MWKTPSLQNGMSQLNYKLIRHRLATCKIFHAFHPCLASTKRWLVVPPSDMLIVYKMNLWFCKNMIKIYSLQNACYLQNVLPNITLTVQNSSLQSFCRQLKFSHSVGEIVRGMDFMNFFWCFFGKTEALRAQQCCSWTSCWHSMTTSPMPQGDGSLVQITDR